MTGFDGSRGPGRPPAPNDGAKRWFEGLLVAAAVLETAHLVALFDRRQAVDGTGLALAFTLGLPWLAVFLGFAVTRARSRLARWLLVALGALLLASAVGIGTAGWSDPAVLLGAAAGLLQLVAIGLLLTPLSRGWTGPRPT